MRVGLFVNPSDSSSEQIRATFVEAASAGLAGVWVPEIWSWDPLVALAAGAASSETAGLELGTAVLRTYPRHPLALAAQALSTQVATGGRLTLGVGSGHAPMIEGSYGYPFTDPVRHVREYLDALRPLLRGEWVEHRSEALTAVGAVTVPGATPPSVLLAALGPRMLQIAGELADGVITVWTGAQLLADAIVPRATRAAEAAGRPAPRVVAAVSVSVTADPGGARARLAESFGAAGELPSYRRLLAAQGWTSIAETLVAGGEDEVLAELRRFAEAGVSDLVVSPVGDETERRRAVEVAAALA